jgi:3-methyladenine DNA glycosylase AlkD
MTDPVDALRDDLRAVAVAADAAPMAAYMKHRFPFLGVKTPARRTASKPLITATRREPIDEVVAIAHGLRAQPEREFHYVASDVLRANRRRLRADHLADMERFITADAWWDTVDALASPTIGTMVRNHGVVARAMDEWIDDDDIWLARVAIIHQLRFGDETDGDRLFGYALRRAADQEFFIRKAIGWALREYAKTDPAAVRAFIDRHAADLSPLTVREATKHLGRT